MRSRFRSATCIDPGTRTRFSDRTATAREREVGNVAGKVDIAGGVSSPFAAGNRVIADALDVMLDNLEDILSVQQVAKAINVSPRHLERCCRDYLWKSPMKVYRNLRRARTHDTLAQNETKEYEIQTRKRSL
jgi:transcriptional regulator GlxA family with amidase domain